MPLMSVILPVYNGAPYILGAISTTLRALPRDAEVLVIDDGSTDGSVDLVKSVDDRRVRLEVNPENIGLARTLNRGLDLTDSEFVARMDADDECLAWRFRLQLSQMRASGASGVFSTALRMNARGRSVSMSNPFIPQRALAQSLLLGNDLFHPSAFLRRAPLQEVRGYAEVRAEDYELWLKLLSRGHDLRVYPIPTIRYRSHDAQTSSNAEWRRKAADEVRGSTLSEHYDSLAHKLTGSSLPGSALLAAMRLGVEPDADRLVTVGERFTREAGARSFDRIHLERKVRALRHYVSSEDTR